MTDEEVIRRAVEYADGWELLGDQETMAGTVAAFVKTPIGSLHVSWERFLEVTAYKDALAMQLVRQIPEDYAFALDLDFRARVVGPDGYCVAYCDGEGHTMNTLRACVQFYGSQR